LLGAAHGDERLIAIARWIAAQHCRKNGWRQIARECLLAPSCDCR